MRIALAALALVGFCQIGLPSYAQEGQIDRPLAPLTGKVTVQTAPDERMRLSRDEIAPLQQPQQAPNLGGMLRHLDPGGLLNGRADAETTHLLRGFGKMDNTPPLGGQLNNFNLSAAQQVQHPPFAPYIWTQSKDGGYYDASGFYKGPTVPGNQLRNYGGRFSDGTPVPMTDVGTNSSGHVWWQNGLKQPYFFTQRQSPF